MKKALKILFVSLLFSTAATAQTHALEVVGDRVELTNTDTGNKIYWQRHEFAFRYWDASGRLQLWIKSKDQNQYEYDRKIDDIVVLGEAGAAAAKIPLLESIYTGASGGGGGKCHRNRPPQWRYKVQPNTLQCHCRVCGFTCEQVT